MPSAQRGPGGEGALASAWAHTGSSTVCSRPTGAYVFVTWLQLALLAAPLPGPAKALLVILGAVALAWATTAALRRIPAVARVL